jgi:hypothetical protein
VPGWPASYLFVMAAYFGGVAIISHHVVAGDIAATAQNLWLLFESRYLPRTLAGLGLFAAVLVAGLGFTRLLLPSVADKLAIVRAPSFIAETGAGAWLLVFGAARWLSDGQGGDPLRRRRPNRARDPAVREDGAGVSTVARKQGATGPV